MSGARSPRPRPAAAVMPTPLGTPPSVPSIGNASDPPQRSRCVATATPSCAPPCQSDRPRSRCPASAGEARPGRPPPSASCVAPLTCPAHVGSWAGLLAAGELVVGDEGDVAYHRADGLAGAAVHTLRGVDVEHAVALVDAVDRAFLDAGLVLDVDAGLGDDVGHGQPPSLADSLRASVDLLFAAQDPLLPPPPRPVKAAAVRPSPRERVNGLPGAARWPLGRPRARRHV